MSKDTVLENYLNSIYFGNRVYGIKTAMEVFFHKKEISQLTDEEILLLLTRINAPSRDIEDSEFQKYFLSLQRRLGIQVSSTYKKFGQITPYDDFPFVSREIQAFCGE